MAGGREYSHSQRKIIDRYYQHKDSILAHRLGEIVSDMALAAGDDKKLAALWKRAEKALAQSKLDPARAARALNARSVEQLGRLAAELA